MIGKYVSLNGRSHAILGVIPGTFDFWQRDPEAWAILSLVPHNRRGPFFLRGVGRLKPGVTRQQAESDMAIIARQVEQANPHNQSGLRYVVIPLRETIVSDVRLLLWVLTGAVLLVFLISISNVANLSLARATARQRETALRLSLGAGRWQLVRQFMTESMILAIAGGAAGVALAQAAVAAAAALRFLQPSGLPRLNEISINARVLAFTVLVSMISAVLFGLALALSGSGTGLNNKLKDGGWSGESGGRGRARGVLVVAQVTFLVLLLIGAGLLIRSFTLLSVAKPGFDAPLDRVLTMFVSPTGPRFSNQPDSVAVFWTRLVESGSVAGDRSSRPVQFPATESYCFQRYIRNRR